MGIVLVNHAGSVVSQDTGRDAEALANNLGIAVLAINRPGTGGFFPSTSCKNLLASSEGYITQTVACARLVDRLADDLGLNQLIIVGRSAGGLGALALARSEVISSTHAVLAAEPPGCIAMSKKEGLQAFKNYGIRQKQLQLSKEVIVPASSYLPRGQAALRIGSILKNVAYDRFHNSAIWSSNAAVGFLSHIAEYQPGIAVTASFAEHSLVVDDPTYTAQLAPIADMRASGSPFIVNRVPKTSHASFDDREFFASLVAPIIGQK